MRLASMIAAAGLALALFAGSANAQAVGHPGGGGGGGSPPSGGGNPSGGGSAGAGGSPSGGSGVIVNPSLNVSLGGSKGGGNASGNGSLLNGNGNGSTKQSATGNNNFDSYITALIKQTVITKVATINNAPINSNGGAVLVINEINQ